MTNRDMKSYLGDGVYANTDGYAIILTTEDGMRVTNAIVLEPEVYEALIIYRQHLENIARKPVSGPDSP